MTLEVIRSTLAWCTVINYGLLIFWFLFFKFAHDWTYRIHNKFYNISIDNFDTINYSGLAFFKILIFTFNLVPYLALRIVG
jgi:hypothetical protein